MSYIGRDIRTGAFRQLDDISSGFDGSDTTHTMQVNSTNVSVGDVNQILLSLGGVIQKPGTDFTISGSTLTFTTAPAANTSFFAILLGSDNGGTVTPTDVSVTKAKLADEVDIFAGTSLSAADLGDGVHIKKADSSADAFTDTVAVLENSGDTRLSILSGTSNEGEILFGDSGLNRQGRLAYRHGSDSFVFQTSNSEELYLTSGGTLSVGDSSPDVDDGGLCLNHGANDAKVLSFKNSDVSHSMTALGEADTYANFGKNSSATGGLFIQGISEGTFPLTIRGAGNSTDTAKSGAAAGFIMLEAAQFNGSTSVASPGSNVNLVTIRSGTDDCVFIFDEEGDFHADSSSTTFDAYEDAHLVRAYDLSHGKGVIDSKFDKFVSYNADKLADLKLIGRNKDGTPNSHVNITGFQRLHNGAIWQQYEKHHKLAEAVYEMAKEALGEDKADAILKKHGIKLLD